MERPMSCKAIEPCLRHSVSRSCGSSHQHRITRDVVVPGKPHARTSMSRLSSILTTFPNMHIHWYRFAK